jgi:branched-chain amino acid transport system permease protein
MINQMMPLFTDFGQYTPFVPNEWGLPFGIEYANAVAFVIMVAVLLVRPSGIAGEAT